MISFRIPGTYRQRCLAALVIASALPLIAIPLWVNRWQAIPQQPVQERPTPDAAGLALERLLEQELPLRLDPTKVYPSTQALAGKPFRPVPLAVSMSALTSGIAPGDYTIHVVGFNLPYAYLRPGDGVAYQIGPMQGKASEVIATFLWRGLVRGGDPAWLYPTACAIQSGVPFKKMPMSFALPIDEVVPDLKEQISTDFFETMQAGYRRAIPLVPYALPLREALIAGGPLGRSAMEAGNERNILLRPGLSEQQRAALIVAGDSTGVFTPAKAEVAPWAEAVPGIAFMRLRLNTGNPTTGTLDLRVVSPLSAPAASAGSPRELPTLLSLFGASFAPGGQVRAKGLVGYPLARQSQPVTFIPFDPR